MTGLSVDLEKTIDRFHLSVRWHMGNELVVILGESGAGKSMTLKLIAGLMKPDKGIVTINGETVCDASVSKHVPSRLRHVGYVFQNLALFPHMTVHDNICYGLVEGKSRRADDLTAGMLETFRIGGLGHRYPREISGGQMQRVALARALIGSPRVLLLDEPFSALDNPLRQEMRELVKSVRERFQIPVVLVTHDLVDACTMADKVIIYSSGKVAQAGQFADLVNNPATDNVRSLLDVSPFLSVVKHVSSANQNVTVKSDN